MNIIGAATIAMVLIVALALIEWLRRVQLPRLIAERILLSIPSGKSYWSWPWQRKLEKLTDGLEIIICEQCHLSGYVGLPCFRCGHRIGSPVWRDGKWSYQ